MIFDNSSNNICAVFFNSLKKEKKFNGYIKGEVELPSSGSDCSERFVAYKGKYWLIVKHN